MSGFKFISICLCLCFAFAFGASAEDVAWRPAELWEDFPGDSFLRIYMFNVTNPSEFLHDPLNVKPRLEEVGPYVYKIRRQKAEASLQFDDQSIKFRERKYFEFDHQASAPRTEEDEFNIVNMQLLIYGTRIASMDSYMDAMYIGWLTEVEGEVMIRRNKVREILFDGMESQIYVKYEEYLEGLNNQNAPPGFEAFEDGRYSYFKNKNGSDNGELRLQTNPTSSYGRIITLDRHDSVSYWNDSTCNGIGGTSDGSLFSPSTAASGSPTMQFAYLPEICRAVMLNRDQVEHEYEYAETGIQATRYILGDSFLNYSREHYCWCTDTGGNCLPDGALDIQSCTLGAPYAITQPRFRNADPVYEESVEWTNDGGGDGQDEPTDWVMEPTTGTVLESKRRFQLNIRVGALKRTKYFKDFPEFLFPILWMEETYKLDDQSLLSLKSALDGSGDPTTTLITETPTTITTTPTEPSTVTPTTTEAATTTITTTEATTTSTTSEPSTPTTTEGSTTPTSTPTTTEATTAPTTTMVTIPTTTSFSTSTIGPTDPTPIPNIAQFNQLHEDVVHLGKQNLFSTVAIILLLVALLLMSLLTLGIQRSNNGRRSQIISDDTDSVASSDAIIKT